MRLFGKLWRSRRGATVVEYGLICALIVLASFAALQSAAGKIVGTLDRVSSTAVAVL